MTDSIRVHHQSKRSCIATVPIFTKPINGLRRPCPTCNIIHRVKTVHLWLDDQGDCLVSIGVLNDLKAAGMPNLEIVASISDPPMLRIGTDRFEQDHANRRIRFWKEPTVV